MPRLPDGISSRLMAYGVDIVHPPPEPTGKRPNVFACLCSRYG